MRAVPINQYHIAAAKQSDGKAVTLTIKNEGSNTITYEGGKYYLLGGFFGLCTKTVEIAAGKTELVGLTIEQAEYDATNIAAGQDFNVGTVIYWDESTSTFTETATEGEGGEAVENRKVGRVTEAKDANGVILFILGPQV